MNLLRKIVLLLAALSLTRVFVTTIGLLLTTPVLIAELTPAESELKVAYEMIAGYCFILTILLLLIGASLYRLAINKDPLRINFALIIILIGISLLHFILAFMGSSMAYIVQFSQSFIWLPILACFIALVSTFVSRQLKQ